MCGFFLLPQLYSLYSIKKEISVLEQKTVNYTNLINKKDTLKKEHEIVQKKRTKISRYIHQTNNPYVYLTAIVDACQADIHIEQIRKNKKNIELIIHAISAERVTNFINKLSQTDLFNNLKLVSLQHDSNTKKLRCTIKGIMKT
jgi:Tfp pilus assembly protein PilN